jgi:hypothetical protein
VVLAQQAGELALDLVEEGVDLVERVAAHLDVELLVRDVGRCQRHGVTSVIRWRAGRCRWQECRARGVIGRSRRRS